MGSERIEGPYLPGQNIFSRGGRHTPELRNHREAAIANVAHAAGIELGKQQAQQEAE